MVILTRRVPWDWQICVRYIYDGGPETRTHSVENGKIRSHNKLGTCRESDNSEIRLLRLGVKR
jgi:hypothetical protein